MLVLEREVQEEIFLSCGVRIVVLKARGDSHGELREFARIGIDAPENIRILRREKIAGDPAKFLAGDVPATLEGGR